MAVPFVLFGIVDYKEIGLCLWLLFVYLLAGLPFYVDPYDCRTCGFDWYLPLPLDLRILQ